MLRHGISLFHRSRTIPPPVEKAEFGDVSPVDVTDSAASLVPRLQTPFRPTGAPRPSLEERGMYKAAATAEVLNGVYEAKRAPHASFCGPNEH